MKGSLVLKWRPMKAKGQVQFLICITNCSYNFFSNAIPFHVSHSPLYKDICRNFWATGLPYASPLKNRIGILLLEKKVLWITLQMEDMIWVDLSEGRVLHFYKWVDQHVMEATHQHYCYIFCRTILFKSC